MTDHHWENTTTSDWTCKYGPWMLFVEYRDSDEDSQGALIEPYYRATAKVQTEFVEFSKLQIALNADTLEEAKEEIVDIMVQELAKLYAAAINVQRGFENVDE